MIFTVGWDGVGTALRESTFLKNGLVVGYHPHLSYRNAQANSVLQLDYMPLHSAAITFALTDPPRILRNIRPHTSRPGGCGIRFPMDASPRPSCPLLPCRSNHNLVV
jgi:hypothetical protein